MVSSLLTQSILECIFQIHYLLIQLKFHLILIMVIVDNYYQLLQRYHCYYGYHSRAQISVENVMRPKEQTNKKQTETKKNSVQESIKRNRNCTPKRVLWY